MSHPYRPVVIALCARPPSWLTRARHWAVPLLCLLGRHPPAARKLWAWHVWQCTACGRVYDEDTGKYIWRWKWSATGRLLRGPRFFGAWREG